MSADAAGIIATASEAGGGTALEVPLAEPSMPVGTVEETATTTAPATRAPVTGFTSAGVTPGGIAIVMNGLARQLAVQCAADAIDGACLVATAGPTAAAVTSCGVGMSGGGGTSGD